MANDTFSEEDFRELHRIAQTAALAAYPNPDRIGCPGTRVLREVANSRLASDHPAYKHVATCSPCLKEMLAFRSELVQRQKRRKRWIQLIAAAAALLILTSVAVKFAFRSGSPTGANATVDQTINLWDRDALRGGNETAPLKEVSLPAARVRVNVILPRLSENGNYAIAVTRDKYGRNVLAKSVGPAVTHGSREIVTVILDLRGTTSGAYFLQTTRDQDEASYYYPLKVP